MFPVYDENGGRRSLSRPWVTWILVAINVANAILLGLLPDWFVSAIAYQYGVTPGFLSGRVSFDPTEFVIRPEWTLLTYSFIHAKWSHLASNMLVLWVFGDNVERATGHMRFLLFYFLCQIAGALAHVVSDPASLVPSIGASAAVSGVVGAYLLVRPSARVVMLILGVMTINLRAYFVIIGWALWQFGEFYWTGAQSDVAYWGHFGGFVAGLLLIIPLRRPGVRVLNAQHVTEALANGLKSLRHGWITTRNLVFRR